MVNKQHFLNEALFLLERTTNEIWSFKLEYMAAVLPKINLAIQSTEGLRNTTEGFGFFFLTDNNIYAFK